ncbi:uncharacterized protein LOC135814344 [Sycon ciliatum]|uniref:uncharacterized protein LOC135814344 n=1 Tax=Sycon ciliatum TaxID=27933 RepID=UPI0031F6C1E8
MSTFAIARRPACLARPWLRLRGNTRVVIGGAGLGVDAGSGVIGSQRRHLAYNAGSTELTTNVLSYHQHKDSYIRDVKPTTNQVDFFQENGYVVMEGLLDPDHLQKWRDVIDSAVEMRGKDWSFPVKGQVDVTNVEMDFYQKVFTQRINLWITSEQARHLLFAAQAVLARAACNLGGINRVRLWHDQALYKEPWANATSWHVDVPYWSFDSVNAISAWIALDDATMANGCMHFIPGSQKLVEKGYAEDGFFREIKIGKNMSDVFEFFPEARTWPSTAVEMKAGSVSFHSGALIHGAGANMTPGRRRAMTMGFMPDGSVFNGRQNILTNEQCAVLKVGDKLTDDTQNPLLYDTGV